MICLFGISSFMQHKKRWIWWEHLYHHLLCVTPASHTSMTVWDVGHLACKHASEGCFPTALSWQATLSNISILKMFSSSHHQAVVYLWEFKVSPGGWMLFLAPICYVSGYHANLLCIWIWCQSATELDITPARFESGHDSSLLQTWI